ncbi:MAG: Ig-like domain-containing protein [Thermoplasmatota archaeon]
MMGRKKMIGSMASSFIALMLTMSAVLLLFPIPDAVAQTGEYDDPIIDLNMVNNMEVRPAHAFNTSSQNIIISWEWPEMWAMNTGPYEVTIEMYDSESMLPIRWPIFHWHVESGTPAPESYEWELNNSLQPSDSYVFNLTSMANNSDTGTYYMDWDEAPFEIMDGTPMIEDISADPLVVDNSGTGVINITFSFNRHFDHLDRGNFTMGLFNYNTMEWIELDVDEPSPENISSGPYSSTAWTHVTIPFDTPTGEYYLHLNAVDVWEYGETWNESIFRVIWREVPPVMVNDTIHMNEDEFALVDLNDHFTDPNGQDLTYYINMSAVENITIVWVNNHTINITAPMDWNGEQDFGIAVTDGIDLPGHNATFTMNVIVHPMPDDLRPTEDRIVMINEVLMETYFDPLEFFYHPDGPVNLTVSIGYEEVVVNDTSNETEKQPIWHFEEGNISVEMNETQQNMSKAMLLQDFEEGSWEFPIAAWIDGEWVMNGTAFVEVDPVNDVPMLAVEGITFYYDEIFTANLADLFYDPDSTNLSFIVDTTAENLVIDYNETTHDIAISVENNWTGNSEFEVNVSDGEDYNVVMIPVEVQMHTYTLSGVVDYEDNETHGLEGVFVTLMVGETEVPVDNVTGEYSVELVEGEYSVSITLGTDMIYDEEAGQSGYIAPELDNMTMDMDKTLDISIEWMEYTESAEEATWEDIDFDSAVKEEEDDTLTFAIPVKNESRTGYGDLKVYLIIYDDEEEWEFNFTWIESDMEYTLEISEDQMDDLPEGKLKYKYSDKAGNETSEMEYTFRDEKQDASLVTVIVLIVLIILVLIALVFIMRKPSEEFDEEEEEEEEGERVCPSCGETIADEEAVECPYCGESLEEE